MNILAYNIEEYISKNAQTETASKGIVIFNQKGVLRSEYSDKTGVWTINVMGSIEYIVKIYIIDKSVKKTSCTCPYDWGGICKHTVAALLHLNKSTQSVSNIPDRKAPIAESVKKDELKKRRAELPGFNNTYFVLDNYKKVNFNNLPMYRELYTYREHTREWKIARTPNTLVFKEIFHDRNNVTIHEIDNKLYIQGNDIQFGLNNQLTPAEFVLLNNISRTLDDAFFNLLHNKYPKEEQTALANFGLEGENFDQYFEYKFVGAKGLYIYLKANYNGLLPKNITEDANLRKYFDSLNSSELVPSKVMENRVMGFIIICNNNIEIMSVIGGMDKKKQNLLKIEYYTQQAGSNYKLDLTDNQRLILENRYIDTENLPNRMQQINKILKLLINETFVYFSVEHNRLIRQKDLERITVSDITPEFVYQLTEDEKFIEANLRVSINDEYLEQALLNIRYIELGILKYNDVIYMIPDLKSYKILTESQSNYKTTINNKSDFLKNFIKPIAAYAKVDFTNSNYDYTREELDFTQKQIFLTENEDLLIIKPAVVYNNKSIYISHKQQIIENYDNKIIEYIRNIELEAEFVKDISELHPNFEDQIQQKYFYLEYHDFLKDNWFFHFFELMQKKHVEIYGLKELKKFKYSPHKAKLNTQINSGQDWFDLHINVSFGNEKIRLQDIKQAIVNKQNYVVLKDGSLGLLPEEWIAKLDRYFRNGNLEKDKLLISKLRFNIIDDLFESIDNESVIQELKKKKQALIAFQKIEKTELPPQITATLRPYQIEGYNWLQFLGKYGWGGILADDMGLGKTIQILTLLQATVNKNKQPNLIVVPTTLLFNWQKEIEKFAPELKAYYHFSNNRNQNTDVFSNYHIIFTTYGTLIRDIEFLKNFEFNYLILDESQAIKNPLSLRYKASVLVKARNRITMTGTPIENSTFDLYAQMNLVNRGIFGAINDFKTNYSNAIDIHRDENIARELQKLIHPFVLRRTKEQVAKELPPKVESIIFCEMDKEQRLIYDAYKNEYRDKLLKKIESEGIGKSKIMILEALTRLRQICDSPALLKDDEIACKESVKIKELINHITEKTTNHKILIFSQFVGMLNLIKEELDKLYISYEYLDGKMKVNERESSVTNFQGNTETRVFLISLKAGGTGLNLTSADYVYIVDPWWNPAVENQAIDRTYRIGQDKHVFAYRMVCKDTIEEKILKLQEKKKSMADDIIQTDENILKTLDINSLRDFLE